MSNDSDPHGEYRRQSLAHFGPGASSTADSGLQLPREHDEMRGQTPGGARITAGTMSRLSIVRDACAIVLLLLALALPWNVYVGAGTPDRRGWIFALLLVVTLCSVGAIVITYASPRNGRRVGVDSSVAKRRLVLNGPYLIVVLAFVLFTLVQTIRGASSGSVAPGIGQGIWFGLAGCLLSAQPVISGATGEGPPTAWVYRMRIVTIAAVTLAVASTLFNLYWRTQYLFAVDGVGGKEVAVVALTSMYGVVALTAVIIASRWILDGAKASRLATISLGASALVAGLVIWVTEAGREIDAFHGIGQGTSTAAVGFEGYLCWAGAAALMAPYSLRITAPTSAANHSVYREAARKVLLLIAFWCLASVVLRAADLIVALSLDLHDSPYDTAAFIAFDGAGAALAIWLRIKFADRAVPARIVAWSSGALVVLTVCRVVVGVALAPRVAYLESPPPYNPVFGNDLAQQITSTFDVVLCGLAMCVLMAAAATGYRGTGRRSAAANLANRDPVSTGAHSARTTGPTMTDAAHVATQIISEGTPAVTRPVYGVMPTIFRGASGSAATALLRIHRPGAPVDSTRGPLVGDQRGDQPDSADAETGFLDTVRRDEASAASPKGSPSADRLLRESTQRFAAGTTYGGPSQG